MTSNDFNTRVIFEIFEVIVEVIFEVSILEILSLKKEETGS